MKCDTVFKKVNMLKPSDTTDALMEGRGRGFKDEREYLEFILEQERVWEKEHLWGNINREDDEL